jgi:hypothetical protein
VQCSAVQCSAVQCSAVQCSAVQCCSVVHANDRTPQFRASFHKKLQTMRKCISERKIYIFHGNLSNLEIQRLFIKICSFDQPVKCILAHVSRRAVWMLLGTRLSSLVSAALSRSVDPSIHSDCSVNRELRNREASKVVILCNRWSASGSPARPLPPSSCTALHCTALHCTALHCTALHCTAALLPTTKTLDQLNYSNFHNVILLPKYNTPPTLYWVWLHCSPHCTALEKTALAGDAPLSSETAV